MCIHAMCNFIFHNTFKYLSITQSLKSQRFHLQCFALLHALITQCRHMKHFHMAYWLLRIFSPCHDLPSPKLFPVSFPIFPY